MHKHVYPFFAYCAFPSHPSSHPIPWLECVHATINVFMSISHQCLLHPYIQLCKTCTLLHGPMCMCQLPLFWSHTLVSMLPYISTCMHATWLPISPLHPFIVTCKHACAMTSTNRFNLCVSHWKTTHYLLICNHRAFLPITCV